MAVQSDITADFFLAQFSSSGHRVTLIRPPSLVIDNIGASMKTQLPRKITSGRISEDGILTIDVKRNSAGGDPDSMSS
jgi:hypothetical protein